MGFVPSVHFIRWIRSYAEADVSFRGECTYVFSPILSDDPFWSVNVPPTEKGKRTALTGALRRNNGPSLSLCMEYDVSFDAEHRKGTDRLAPRSTIGSTVLRGRTGRGPT